MAKKAPTATAGSVVPAKPPRKRAKKSVEEDDTTSGKDPPDYFVKVGPNLVKLSFLGLKVYKGTKPCEGNNEVERDNQRWTASAGRSKARRGKGDTKTSVVEHLLVREVPEDGEDLLDERKGLMDVTMALVTMGKIPRCIVGHAARACLDGSRRPKAWEMDDRWYGWDLIQYG
ncbi:hypothetical protein B0H11DRAFT_1909790 [Mycena galericulata]|nr:hypothetical protein B0H11DRAFT_1909790 [Mycena galericulata]